MSPSAKPRVKSARKRERVGLVRHDGGTEAWVAWRWAGCRKSEVLERGWVVLVDEDGEAGEPVSNVSALRGE